MPKKAAATTLQVFSFIYPCADGHLLGILFLHTLFPATESLWATIRGTALDPKYYVLQRGISIGFLLI